MRTDDGLIGVAVAEQRGVMDDMVEGRKAGLTNLDGNGQLGDVGAGRHNEQQKAASQNMHDQVISKYRGRGVFLTTCVLVLLAVTVLLIDRSKKFSNLWILFAIAFAAFIVFLQSKNISQSYIAEAQSLMQKEVSYRASWAITAATKSTCSYLNLKADDKIRSGDFEAPESAEWLNAVIAKLILILNTDLLLPVMDILEDALKDKFPYIISAVRVEEIDLGITPFRVRKMTRMDPSVPLSKEHEPEEDNSRHINMEVEFGYDGTQRKQASVGVFVYCCIAPSIYKSPLYVRTISICLSGLQWA